MGLGKSFACLAWRRVTSSNNQLRVTLGGVSQTVSITPGAYPLGYGAGNPNGEGDASMFGEQSLLERIRADILAAFGEDLIIGLQTRHHAGSGYAQSPTGYVWASVDLAGSHALDFSVSTLPREWLGVAPEVSSVSWSGTSLKQVSNFSSSLAMIGDRAIMEDRAIERGSDVQLVADDGITYQATFSATRYSRELRFQVDGFPEADRDNPYNHLRRFYRSLREGGCAKRFYYIRDEETVATGGAWDPDGSTEAKRRGWLDLVALGPMDWDVRSSNAPAQTLWEPPAFKCARYVAGS